MKSPSPSFLISARNLSFGHHRKYSIVQNLSFELPAGKLLWIRGPNGIGKTTLLRTILGKSPVHDGELTVQVRASSIGYLPQLQNRFFHLPVTLFDVISFSVRRRISEQDVLELQLLEQKHLRIPWNTASGGERKRTLLTRILIDRPRLLLLDEPLSHLDEESFSIVLAAVKRFYSDQEGSRAAVIVEHDVPPPEVSGQYVEQLFLKPSHQDRKV